MPHHAHSIDRWDDATGSNLYEYLAGVNDLLLARATFAAPQQQATDQQPPETASRLRRAWRWMRATG